MDGSYSLLLFGRVETPFDHDGNDGTSLVELDSSISQAGGVAIYAVSLSILSTGPVILSMNGSDVPLFPNGAEYGHLRFMGDISAFTRTTVEVTITTHSTILDYNAFSSTAINNPEPATLMTLLSAAASL